MGSEKTKPPAAPVRRLLVTRSKVQLGKQYSEYLGPLRRDFFYSCAYCTMMETEGGGIRFTIDHYEPRRARPDLEDDYSNLIYSCDTCNMLKGDRCPPPNARADGYRFFRPDEDFFDDHFELKGIRLEPKSKTGYFNIHAVRLNRQMLRRLREIRQRFYKCDEAVASGIQGLRGVRLDQLPVQIRGKVIAARKDIEGVAQALEEEIDGILRKQASSPLLDDDPDAEAEAKERTARLRELEGLYPGAIWRARRGKSGG